MTRERTSRPEDAPPMCTRQHCDLSAAFWLYHAADGCWRPLCDRHTLRLHPSIEINAWLESGYATPIELGPPNGPPATPRDGRTVAFREIVDRAMGWSE